MNFDLEFCLQNFTALSMFPIFPSKGCSEPPFKVSECGRGSFTMPVEISFKTFERQDRRRETLYYEVDFTELTGSKIEELKFVDPSKDFEKRLRRAGALVSEK